MTPVWALRKKLPIALTEKLQTYFLGRPTQSALAIRKLRRNMRISLEEIQEQYSPADGNDDESFHLAWMEHKRELRWSNPERYPNGSNSFPMLVYDEEEVERYLDQEEGLPSNFHL